MDTNLKMIAKIADFAGVFALTGCAAIPYTDTVHFVAPK